MRLPSVVTLGLVFSCGTAPSATMTCEPPASTPGPTLQAPTFDGGVVLWVGAHPDDESVASPLLAEWCARSRCVFLVLTQGEGGKCGLPGGCQPDLRTVRVLEMQASARLFDAGLIQETLPNASAKALDARNVWVATAGSEAALVERVARVIRDQRVDTIVTFDPRHGVTCHGEHRAAAALAVVAADAAGFPRARMLLVSSLLLTAESKPGTACLLGFRAPDAGDLTHSFGPPPQWSRLGEVLRAHPSQFGAETVAAAERTPDALRTMWFRTGDTVGPDDAVDPRDCR